MIKSFDFMGFVLSHDFADAVISHTSLFEIIKWNFSSFFKIKLA